LPSAVLIGTLSYYRFDQTIPETVRWVYRWAMIGWLAGLVIVLGFGSNHVWIIFLLAFVTPFIFAVACREDLGLCAKSGGWRHISILHPLFFAVAAMLTMCMTSVPLVLVLHIAERYVDGGSSEKFVGVFVWLATTIISLMPGYMYMNVRVRTVGVYQPAKFALLGVFVMSYVVLGAAAMFVSVSTAVLRLAGVYSNELQTFEVLQPTLVSAAEAAGLSVTDEGKTTLLHGYVRYDFGGTRLLCRASFDPATISVEAVRAAHQNKVPDPGVVAGSGCVQASSTELRALRLPVN
jgi:hypothetical protein